MKALVLTLLGATLFVEQSQQLPEAIGLFCWTEWFDRDDPTGTGDWETLTDLRQEYPGQICDEPLQIKVLTTAGDSVASTDDVISFSDTIRGFACENKKQTKTEMCTDYKVRFKCPLDFCWEQV